MTETVHLQQAPQEAALAPEHMLTPDAILGSVEERGIVIDNRESVGQSLQTLRSEFGIQDEAFDDFKRTIVLTAAAEKLAETADSDAPISQRTADKEYVADVVMGIAGDYTDFDKDEQYAKPAGEFEPSSEHRRRVYEKYNHPELSSELNDFIHSAKFDKLRERLGVKEENPFDVFVLTVDTMTDQGFTTAPGPDSDESVVEAWQARMEYMSALKKRASEFAGELGQDDGVGIAWVTTFDDGSRALCVGSTLAEKVLYPSDEVRADGYTQDNFERDLAIVEHEYVHTQGMITDGKVGLGIGLEELRAEHFSGNKQGYVDIKRFFAGVKMVTGYNPVQSFEIDGKPYDQDEFLADIARHNGLSGLLDAMAVIPTAYAQDESASEYIKAIVERDGGLSGLFQGIYDRAIKKHGDAEVNHNISAFIDNLYGAIKDNKYITVESWFAYGGVKSLRDIAIDKFRSRHPDASDGYDYAA